MSASYVEPSGLSFTRTLRSAREELCVSGLAFPPARVRSVFGFALARRWSPKPSEDDDAAVPCMSSEAALAASPTSPAAMVPLAYMPTSRSPSLLARTGSPVPSRFVKPSF